MTHRKYPESFFKDLTKFAEKDILPKQAQLNTEYADYREYPKVCVNLQTDVR